MSAPMTRMTVFLDRQHSGQIRKPQAYGAFSGHHGRHEADMTADYLLACERSLRLAGVDVIPISDGTYRERHARVLDYAAGLSGPCVYVAAHINAGGGDYGCVFHDHRSTMGKSCAEFVADSLDDACPELARVLAKPCTAADWTKNAFATVRGIYAGRPFGLCFEPCFLDNDTHNKLLESRGLARIGEALANGIITWMENR